MILRLDETIGIKFREYVRQNQHQLNQNQVDALTRYANNPEILRHLSGTLYAAFEADRDRVTLNSECRFYIQEIIRVYE